MRVYSKIRSMLETNKNLLLKFEQMETKLADHDNSIMLIMEYIKQFEEARQQEISQQNRAKIGFKPKE